MISAGAEGHGRKLLATERPVTESRIERDGIKPGTKAPGFSLPDLTGQARSLEAYRGKRVLLVFSDPNCGPCDALAPDLVRIQKERLDLQFVMVSRGDAVANQEKARFHGFPFPVVIQDGWKISKEYGIFATPVAFLIDEKGIVARPVGIGAAQILALVDAEENAIVPRWRALWPIAAAFAGGLFAAPLRAGAQFACPEGQVKCGGQCVNFRTDRNNCGACGKQCPSGSICVGGQCVLSCAPGQTNCGGTCVDLQSDRYNCGRCGSACPSGSICSVGTCVLTCAPGQTICNGTCVDLQHDQYNCGSCGTTCPPGTICSVGTCVVTCGRGQTNCRGACTNLVYDPQNCGACGKICPSGQVCRNGKCVTVCA